MNMDSKIIKKGDVDDKVGLSSRLDMIESAESVSTVGKKIISEEDLHEMKQAQKIMDKAMAEAKLIRTKAKELYLQVEEKMAEARQQGFERGFEEGKATVTERLVEIHKQNEEFLKQLEKHVLNLVCEISEKIIGERIQASDQVLLGMVKQALLAVMGSKLTIYLNSDDLERLRGQEPKLTACLDAMQTMSLRSSANVIKGGCVIESEMGTIDAQLEIQMNAIRRALGIHE